MFSITKIDIFIHNLSKQCDFNKFWQKCYFKTAKSKAKLLLCFTKLVLLYQQANQTKTNLCSYALADGHVIVTTCGYRHVSASELIWTGGDQAKQHVMAGDAGM